MFTRNFYWLKSVYAQMHEETVLPLVQLFPLKCVVQICHDNPIPQSFKIHLYRKSRYMELRNWGLCLNLKKNHIKAADIIFSGWSITFLTEMLQYKLINLIIYILQKSYINFEGYNIVVFLLIFCIYLNCKSKKTCDINKFHVHFFLLFF